MDIHKMAADIFSLGASRRIRRKQAEFQEVSRRRETAVATLARVRESVNGQVESLVTTKVRAVESLRLIRKISRNLGAKWRLIAEGSVGPPPIEQISRIESTISAADIAKHGARGLAVGTSTTLGAWALIGSYGTASTGTAISSLSGAAASNAILAWLGGGSLAAGGGGIAAGTAVLGGIMLVPAVVITGAFSHISANKTIKQIDEQIVRALTDINEFTRSSVVLQALGRRVEEVDIATNKARVAFDTEMARTYKSLFPYGLLSKMGRYIRRLLGGSYFSKADAGLIGNLLQTGQALARLIDQKVLDDRGQIL